jgi:hypothetical protein
VTPNPVAASMSVSNRAGMTLAPAGAGAEPPLLPEPTSVVGTADPLALLYLFEAKDQTLGVEQGTSKIAALQTERTQALQKEQQAISREDDAAKHHSFWDDLGSVLGDVAKVAGVVASIAAVVCTFGAATPIVVLAVAGAVLSSASLADGEFHILHKLGVDPSTAGWIDVGMGVAGAACSMGASLASGAQATKEAATVVSRAAAVTTGAATIGEGSAAIEAGEAKSDGEQAAADEALAKAHTDRSLRFTQRVIDEIQTSDDESKQILGTLAATKESLDETATNAAMAVRG